MNVLRIQSVNVTHKKFDYIDQDSFRMTRVLSGKLQINVTDFKPTKHIEFSIINENAFISWPTDFERIKNGPLWGLGDFHLERTYTQDVMKLLRNTLYAQYGYAFKVKNCKRIFRHWNGILMFFFLFQP